VEGFGVLRFAQDDSKDKQRQDKNNRRSLRVMTNKRRSNGNSKGAGNGNSKDNSNRKDNGNS
jgi:hypothetical protein